jgi:homopolymeric O-antigen transport system permease protein
MFKDTDISGVVPPAGQKEHEAQPSAGQHLPRTVIQSSRGWIPLNLKELSQYREVLYFLIWRDIKVRYKQTAIGVAWAVVQPFTTMVVLAVFLGRMAKVPSDGVPYPIFVFTSLVPWLFFAHGLSQSATSLVASGELITKVYFPRLLVPTARVLSGAPDVAVSFLLLLCLCWYYGVRPNPVAMLWIPVFLALALVTALAMGLWLSALHAQYRDIQHAVPFMVQVWFFATPIAYPSSLLAEPWRLLYGLNPMVGVVEGFRWALLGTANPPALAMIVSSGAALTLLLTGAFFFRRMEKTFADVL